MNLFFLQSWLRVATSPRTVRFCITLIFVGISFFLVACGKKGPPVPPIGT